MSIYALKPKFQNLLRPLVRQLAAKGVTANQVTLLACLFSILLGVVLALFPTFSSLFFLIPIWLFLRMALNAIDGMLAREFNQKSRLGGYLMRLLMSFQMRLFIFLLLLSRLLMVFKSQVLFGLPR